MRALGCALAACLLLAACKDKSTPPPGSDKPIEVATMISACQGVAECEKACADGRGPACVAAGHAYEYGREVGADAERAYRYYVRACELDDPGGCYNQAILLEAGRGVTKDPSRALDLYNKVCAKGSKTACERAQTLSETSSRAHVR